MSTSILTWDWVEDAGLENGNYQNRCGNCGALFIGHKRRIICKHCSTLVPPEAAMLDGMNGELMVMAAHRYCLGRRSYIVGSCIDWLTKWWEKFPQGTQQAILRDTAEALLTNLAGDTMDIDAWMTFGKKHWQLADPKIKAYCMRSLAYREEQFPFEEITPVERPDYAKPDRLPITACLQATTLINPQHETT